MTTQPDDQKPGRISPDTATPTAGTNQADNLRLVYEHNFDNPDKEPENFLGRFRVTQVLSDDMYAEKFVGVDDEGKTYLVTEHEVSGFYNPGRGGSRYTIEELAT